MKELTVFFLIISICLGVCSCGKSQNELYAEEAVSGTVTDEEILSSVYSVCECLGYTEEIVCFDKWSEVSERYALIMLDYMATKYYAKYSANKELFEQLAEHYPTLSVGTMIPQKDYENSVYRCFGGYERVTHRTLPEYAYLDKINAYLSVGNRIIPHTALTPVSCEETENTYRFKASFADRGVYMIILVKREKGEPYIISVQHPDGQ